MAALCRWRGMCHFSAFVRRVFGHVVATMRVSVLSIAVAPLFVACTDDSSGTTDCFDEASKAGNAIEKGAWHTTDAYLRFADTVTEQGAIFGVPSSTKYSDFFERSYASISGVSPYENPEAGQAYQEALDACTTATPETKDEFDFFFEPPEESWPTILCVAEAVHSAEQKHGAATVGYSETFKNFAYDNTPRDEGLNYPSAEGTYTAITGRSPLVSAEATEAFRQEARGCPAPP